MLIFYYLVFGNAITQKDIADIKRMNYVYRRY